MYCPRNGKRYAVIFLMTQSSDGTVQMNPEYIRANCDYPSDWDGTIERIEEVGNTIVLAGHVLSADKRISCHVVSFIKLRNGKISELDEYWADDGDAPDWRREMRIGRPIR